VDSFLAQKCAKSLREVYSDVSDGTLAHNNGRVLGTPIIWIADALFGKINDSARCFFYYLSYVQQTIKKAISPWK
jgi:hypothetical protein